MTNSITALQSTLSDKTLLQLVCMIEDLDKQKTTPAIANARCAIKSELFARDAKKFSKWSSKNTGNLSPRKFYL